MPEVDTSGAERTSLRHMRLLAAGAALLLVAGLVGLALRLGGEPQAAAVTPPLQQAPTAPVAAATPLSSPTASEPGPMLPAAQDVLMLGDSLALSTYAWIADLLPDRYVSWEAQVGRTTAEARQALEELAAAGRVPPVIVVSSGTNDVDATTLRNEAERILAIAGPNRCVVWADVVRPEEFADGMAAANDALEQAWQGHPNVIPVRWTRMIRQHPDWLTSDGVHPVEAGNMARARAFADAVLRCSPLDPDAPKAAQQYLPQASFLAPGGGSVPGVGAADWQPSSAAPSRSSTAPRSEARPSRSAPAAGASASATTAASHDPPADAPPASSPAGPSTPPSTPSQPAEPSGPASTSG